MVRVFIAAEPSAEIRNAAAAAGRSLEGCGRLSPVNTGLMHITLKFLGEIPDTSLEKVRTALDSIKESSLLPYTLSVSGVSTFGRPPRVIKADIRDGGASAKLAAEIEKRLTAAGFPKEDKPFSPHLTLARVREAGPQLAAKTAALKTAEFGCCEIREICIKKSVLTPSGPVYTTLHRIGL